jgi:putative tryptophan/tyrosine transport system substrate-binding protein
MMCYRYSGGPPAPSAAVVVIGGAYLREGSPIFDVKRREFIALIGGTAVWPLMARAQPPAMPVVGFLNGQSLEEWADLVDAVRQGLSQAGFIEGRSVAIEYRFAGNASDRLPALASELVSRKVHLIVATGGDITTRAAAAATSSIPIVGTFGADPVETGLVVSLNRPGKNLTGVSLFNAALAEKQVEMLHLALPGTRDIAALINPRNLNSERFVKAAEAAAGTLGLNLIVMSAERDGELETTFSILSHARLARSWSSVIRSSALSANN